MRHMSNKTDRSVGGRDDDSRSMSGARSWIDGTMEVISGLAPRPSTPQRGQHQRPLSAPNSPAGSRASYPGIQRVPSHGSHDYQSITRVPSYDYPGISRVPSADATERSMHNDSGHGKSTAQIIRDLKASNARFSAKTAEMEAEFMNEINRVTRSFEEKNRALEASLKEKNHQIASMEARCTSTEARIRERDAQMSKLKEEAAFQRHTISDLKNQLYEIKEAEYDKRDDVDKWSLEKEEMAREIENLRGQIDTLKKGVEAENSLDSQQILQNWKHLEESQKALSDSTKRLHETQSALANVENDSKRTVQEHARVVSEHSLEIGRLKKKHADAQAEWSRSEMEMQAKIERLESDDNPVIKELKAQLQECDTTMASLRDEIERHESKVTELDAELSKVRTDAQSREAYRREEAEDLRVMLDAQADEIEHLKEDLEECQREIFTKEDDLVEAEKELEEQLDRNGELKREIEALKQGGAVVGIEGGSRALELENELAEARESLLKLEKELEEANINHDAVVNELREEINGLIAARDDVESRLAAVEEERDQAREELASASSNRDLTIDEGTMSTKQMEDMRTNLEREHKDKLSAAVRPKEVEIAELQKKVKELEAELEEAGEKNRKLETLQMELDAANQSLKEKTDEIATLQSKVSDNDEAILGLETKSSAMEDSAEEVKRLQETVKELEEKNKAAAKTKKQLRDAQIALVALDNDRKKVAVAYREKVEELEREKTKRNNDDESGKAESRIAELVDEIDKLKKELKEKDASLKTFASNGHSGKDEEALRSELEAIKREKDEQQALMKEKLADRDTTISALVKSSVTQDQKLRSMKAEVQSLKSKLEAVDGASPGSGAGTTQTSRAVNNGDDADRLRSSLHDYKETEAKLTAEISSYKKNLFAAELEAQRLRDELDDIKSTSSRDIEDKSRRQVSSMRKEMDAMAIDHQEKIQERDAAIATLVNQSMSQEARVSSLEAQLASLRAETGALSPGGTSGPSWGEIRRLQKESEIFAGQIIEQDEEMEGLKCQLEDRQAQIAALTAELAKLKTKGNSKQIDMEEVVKLRAELDEMQEANRTQLMELRDLRKKLRESKANADQVVDLKIELAQAKRALEENRERAVASDRDDPTMKRELENALVVKARTEKAMSEQEESIRSSKAAIRALEAKLKEREDTIAALRRDLSKFSNNDDKVAALQTEVDTLRRELEKQTTLADEAQSSLKALRAFVDEKKSNDDEKNIEIEALEMEVDELRKRLQSLEDDRAHIQELKERLARAEEDRESVEKSIVDSYERKMSLMKLNKDVTIDGLRKELAEAKGRNSGDVDDLMKRIRQLEAENKDLSDDLEAKLDQKTTKIYALQQTLNAQEQLVDNMRAEMDQLQSSMERTSANRRAEIEEMQQEVLESSAKTTRQEREITVLKLELDECKLEHETKVARLMERISSMESSPMVRSVQEQHVDHRLNEVKERLEQMSWRNTSLETENQTLRSRLDKAQSVSQAIEEELDNIVDMEEEIAFLQNKVKELETQLSAATAAAAAAPSIPRAPVSAKQSSQDSRERTLQQASPAKRGSSSSGRLGFLKLRTRGGSKDMTADEIPPLPSDDM